MNSAAAGPGFEVVARQDFSGVTLLLEIRHPMLATAPAPATVDAAESCQVGVIHPGKPWDMTELGLDELIDRAKPFFRERHRDRGTSSLRSLDPGAERIIDAPSRAAPGGREPPEADFLTPR